MPSASTTKNPGVAGPGTVGNLHGLRPNKAARVREWLRRERCRLDAREHLRTALDIFRGMGTEAFAGRAERELLSTGERARKRTADTLDQLPRRRSST
jgi:hypothetical protein